MRDRGWVVDVLASSGAQLPATLRQALESDPDLLVGGGGDGTVSAAADAAVRTDTPLGVLPLGTFNHFARDAGIPTDLDRVARILARRSIRPVDIAEVNGQFFLNNASVGLYPRLVYRREALRQRHGYGKWSATARAGIYVLRKHPIERVAIETAGRLRVRRTPFVLVGNNPYEMDFFVLGRRPRLDTGNLGVYFSRHEGRTTALRIAMRAVFGRLHQDRDFEASLVPQVTLRSHRRELNVAIDGEARRMRPPLRYRIHPRRLRLVAPLRRTRRR
jgi:diacylglycerol kinase family enzyme